MSSVASVEFARSPENQAEFIDRELADIAGHLPDGIMASVRGAGFAHEIHRVPEVGVLRAMYLGFLVGKDKLGRLFNYDSPHDRYSGIRIIAQNHDGTAGFYQDFALDYWKKPSLISPTTAEDMAYLQAACPELPIAIQSLHQAYMQRALAESNTVSLAQHARNRSA